MDFYSRLQTYLKKEFPDKINSFATEELHTTMENGVRLAQLYKLETEADIVRFIDLQWRIGDNFDTNQNYPWAKEILQDIRIKPSQKITMLRDAYAMYCAKQVAETS